jgi:hypothetical protein
LEGGLGLSVKPPLALLKRWIDESYCAVAPKRLVASLAAEPAGDEKLTRRRAPRRLVHPRK